MASFVEKLRLDNLYPSIPTPTGLPRNNRYPLFEKFQSEIAPMQQRERGRIEQIGQQAIQQPPITGPMDVVFQPSISSQLSDIATARRIHGDDATFPMTGYQSGRLGLQERELEQKRLKQEADIQTAQERTGIAKQRADVYEFKSKNPNLKFSINKVTGTMQAIDPTTAKVVQDFGQTQLGEEELINLNQEKKLEQIGATGEEARRTEGVRQEGRESLEEIKARHAEELKRLGASLAGTEPRAPTQERAELLRRAEEAKNTNPEWKKWIKLAPSGGGFEIVNPGSFAGVARGPSPEIYQAIKDFIYSPTETPTAPLTEETKTEDPNRQRAIDELTKAGKPVTPANIDYVVKQLGQ